jgi:phospholipid-translocating ATPase
LIPCDCIVIKTSDPENKCFVETKGLDGETNYKYKTSFLNNISGNNAATALLISPENYSLGYLVKCGSPMPQINQFEGTIE